MNKIFYLDKIPHIFYKGKLVELINSLSCSGCIVYLGSNDECSLHCPSEVSKFLGLDVDDIMNISIINHQHLSDTPTPRWSDINISLILSSYLLRICGR